MTPITDIDKYNNSMQKSLQDKLFFLDYVKMIDAFVDFGCADGTLLEAIHEYAPNLELVGIDMEQRMLDICEKKLPNALFIQKCTPSLWTKAPTKFFWNSTIKMALNLSSVLHEVYSYGTPADIDKFWTAVRTEGYDYIFIRDMIYTPEDYSATSPNLFRKVMNVLPPEQIKDFTNIWGPIDIHKNMKHLLLKYRYKENWTREVREQYLPVTAEQVRMMLADKYDCIYMKEYTLPFLIDKIKEDIGYDISDLTPTHMQAIFKLKR